MATVAEFPKKLEDVHGTFLQQFNLLRQDLKSVKDGQEFMKQEIDSIQSKTSKLELMRTLDMFSH